MDDVEALLSKPLNEIVKERKKAKKAEKKKNLKKAVEKKRVAVKEKAAPKASPLAKSVGAGKAKRDAALEVRRGLGKGIVDLKKAVEEAQKLLAAAQEPSTARSRRRAKGLAADENAGAKPTPRRKRWQHTVERFRNNQNGEGGAGAGKPAQASNASFKAPSIGILDINFSATDKTAGVLAGWRGKKNGAAAAPVANAPQGQAGGAKRQKKKRASIKKGKEPPAQPERQATTKTKRDAARLAAVRDRRGLSKATGGGEAGDSEGRPKRKRRGAAAKCKGEK